MELITEIAENKFKLCLDSSNTDSLESIIDATRVIEEFDIWLEIKSDDEVQRLKKLFQAQGSNVKKLSWINWSQYQLSAAEITELLNFLPKVESLKLSSWQKEFTGDVGKLQLENVKSLEISESGNFIIDFVSNVLPENTIEALKISHLFGVDSLLSKFLMKQTSIKHLNINANLETVEPLTKLKLDYLRCILHNRSDKKLENQRKFLQTLIRSQVNLTTLDLFNDRSFRFVTDEIFADICALSKLENLSISIDSLTSDGIKAISKLSALKKLTLKSNDIHSLDVVKELSTIENLSLENLILKLWSLEVPAETYEAIGQNYTNLKSLTITLEVSHRISFFARSFPNLENLSVIISVPGRQIEFTQVCDLSDDIKSWKLKNLNLRIWGSEVINTEAFLKFLSNFTCLEKLFIYSTLPFKADFFNQLADNLNTIRSIKLSAFKIKNNETFETEVIESLKKLRSKVDSISLYLSSFQKVVNSTFTGENDDGVFRQFTFQPLIDALKGVYEQRARTHSDTFCIIKDIGLYAGKYESWDEELKY